MGNAGLIFQSIFYVEVTSLRFNLKGSILAVGHGDCSVYIFGFNREREFSQWDIVCNLNSPCLQIQFSNDSNYLKVLDMNQELTRWSLNLESETVKAYTKPFDPESIKFHGDPLPIGWDVVGKFIKLSLKCRLEDVHISTIRKLIKDLSLNYFSNQ